MVTRTFKRLTGASLAAKKRQSRALAGFSSRRSSAFARGRAPPRMNPRTGGFTGIELKFADLGLSASALTVPADASGGEHDPSTDNLAGIAQGDGESQRDGRRCVIKSVFVNGQINIPAQVNQTAADAAASFFIALVWDKQTNGSTINSEDVFVNPAGVAATAASPLRNLQFISRFQVLATRRFDIQSPEMVWDGTNVEQGGRVRKFAIYKKLEIPVNHTGTTAAIASVSDNSLHIVGYTTSTGMVPTISYSSRVRFVG